MPALLRGMAKTAVVAGTSQATRNAVNRRSAEKNYRAYSEAQHQVQGQQVAYAQPQQAPPPPKEDPIAQLERLGALRDQGVPTEEEFQAQKAKILGT